MLRVLIFLVSVGALAIRALCRRRADLMIEDLALRQQVTALKKERPRPQLADTDRAFWVALRASWPGWACHLLVVNGGAVESGSISVDTGQRSSRDAIRGGLASTPKFVGSSGRWRKTVGVRPVQARFFTLIAKEEDTVAAKDL